MHALPVRDAIRQTMVAAIYVVLVLVFSFMSFETIQFRVAEIMLILVFFDKKSVIGLLTGTFIANLTGPFGIVDAAFGTLASAIALFLMILLSKTPLLAFIVPGLVNGVVIGLMLHIMIDLPFFVTAGWVFAGETAVMVLLAYPLWRVLRNHERFLTLFE